MPPRPELATIDEAKLRYLLDRDHPQNEGKAAFFAAHGFGSDRLGEFEAALRAHLSHDAAATPGPFGVKLVCDGPLPSPDGRAPWARSVWMIDAGSDRPRFITAHPLRRRT